MGYLDFNGFVAKPNQPYGETMSDIRPGIGGFPTTINKTIGAFLPSRFLPVRFIQKVQPVSGGTPFEYGVVMPAGTIVTTVPITPNNSILGTDGSGDIAVGFDVAGNLIKYNIDSLYGYDKSLLGAIVPANGSDSDAVYHFTAFDALDSIKTLKADGTYAAAGDESITVPAHSRPLGVVIRDVYQFNWGKYAHNDQPSMRNEAIATTGVIEYLYVRDASDFSTYQMAAGDTASVSNSAGYRAVLGRYAFLVLDSSITNAAGLPLTVDAFGNPAVFDTNISATPANTYLEFKVGKIVNLDYRWPRGLVDLVDTWPGAISGGTNTGGLPPHLFDFAKRILEANGASAKIEDVVNAVKNGDFGIAYVNIDFS